ncbi:O-antigen ligase [Flavobacterium sp. CF108]|uniref:O-antigen ligase family protein n=1 Tax=unclassified Flavobacterium TaxID=196869 RepID=UPI0008BEA117|nr:MULTISPECIES: O-antigen ligase family protein [unclassified Flavobacterium]SEO27063.1 O-antigen ligase [Flavobacterium sp. fv08]SHG45872.1 O-antigen ligase [Flavobacterium sp. CF108]
MNTQKIDSIISEVKGKYSIPNFIVLLFISSLLIIDFLPYFKSVEIINPQFLYLSVLNVIIAAYFYFNSSLIAADIFYSIKRNYIFKLYLAFLFFCAISYFAAKNTSLVFTKFTEIVIVFCLFINLSILLKNKLDLLYKIIFIVSISALIQSCQQLCHFIIIPRHASIMDLLNGMKGNTGNINILAASLTIKIPFLLLGIAHFTTYKKWFLVFILFSVTSVIFLTGARTPLINLFLIYLIYIIYLLKEFSFKRAAVSKILFLTIPVLTAILFANSIFQKSKDKNRYVSLENRVSQINTEDASSKARLLFWNNAIKMSGKSPVLGIGLGNYQVESIPYERTTSNDSTVSLHTHNDFLEILAETGILNGLIYLSIFICVFIINLKRLIKPQNKESQIIALLTLLLLIVYGIDSFFNFPMYRPTMAIFFSLILALSLTNSEINQIALPNKISLKIITSIIIVVSILTSYSAFIIYKASNLEYLIARDDINVNLKGFLTGDQVVNKMAAYPNTFSSSESFYEYAGIYYIREKQYDKALKCFSKAKKINGYSGRIEFYKNVISKNKGDIDSAYIYIKQAFYLRPRNYAIFNAAINFAIAKKDTLEILKQSRLFSQYRPMPQTWDLAARGLKFSGYNYQNLLKFIDQGLKKFPQDSTLTAQKNQLLITSYLNGGQNFENKSDLNNALQFYEKALKIDPKNVYISQNIGFNYLKQGQNKKAINALLEALKYPGLKDGKTEFFLGISYLRENDKTNALKYFNLSKDKNYPAAKQLMAKSQNNNLADEAILKKRKNDLLIADLITEGQNFEEKKEMDKALVSYQKALRIDPKSIYAAQNIGFYYLKVGQSKKAINYLLDALKYPGLNDGKTEYFLAVCYLKEDDKTNACKYLNISKDKNYSDAQQLLRMCK